MPKAFNTRRASGPGPLTTRCFTPFKSSSETPTDFIASNASVALSATWAWSN